MVGHVIHVYIIVNVLTCVHSRLQVHVLSTVVPTQVGHSYLLGGSLTELPDKAPTERQVVKELDFDFDIHFFLMQSFC